MTALFTGPQEPSVAAVATKKMTSKEYAGINWGVNVGTDAGGSGLYRIPDVIEHYGALTDGRYAMMADALVAVVKTLDLIEQRLFEITRELKKASRRPEPPAEPSPEDLLAARCLASRRRAWAAYQKASITRPGRIVTLSDLGLSALAWAAFDALKIGSLEDLLDTTPAELTAVHRHGPKILREVRAKLKALDLTLKGDGPEGES